MKVSFLRRLVKEDFPQKDKDLVGKIGYVINPAMEQLSQALRNNLTWADNMAAQINTIAVTVDASGNPTTPLSFVSSLSSPVQHIIVTRAVNTSNSNSYPTGAPFVSFIQQGTNVVIQNVTGLPANTTFNLTMISSI